MDLGNSAHLWLATMGGVTIMFNLQPEFAARIRRHRHWVKVDDADEMFRFHKSNGAKIASVIEDKPWGFREYAIRDLNGYRLRIAGQRSSEAPKSNGIPTWTFRIN